MGSVICVSIGRGRHRHLIAEYKHLADVGAKLVELRLDYVQSQVNLKRILAERPCPVVITCRREQDGGMWKGTEEQRLMLLRTAIVDGVDYVDLEEDIAGGIPRFGTTKRIVSYHNFHETPHDLPALHARLAALNADIVKIATLANDPQDNLRMLRMVKEATVPTIGLCMGEIGTPTRILTGKFGSPFSYATFQIERTLAPGQLSHEVMRDLYRYEQIDADTEVYGVIADPVAHSMSPLVHNAGFAELKLNKVYVPFRVSREQLPTFLKGCEELGVKGLSVTIPHKEAVIDHLTRQDDAVHGIHACNTVLLRDGQMHGFNTDAAAAIACIEKAFLAAKKRASLEGVKALVLGAGGVAKAVVFGLKRHSASVVISNRTAERAEELASMFRCNTIPWDMRHTTLPDLIVNCTPLGMHPKVNETPFDGVYLNSNTVVFDTVYNPEQTLLVKQARESGCTTVTGVEMFVGQAVEQFQHFTGETAPIETMRNAFRRAISAVRT
jgi:3-dehydroquinate dehydratase / shikimate dehydrogenase